MRIQNKLFIAFILAGITLVALMFFAIQWSLTRGVLEFINTKERDRIAPFVKVLEQRYRDNGNWHWIDGRHRLFHDLFKELVVDKNPEFFPRPRRPGPPPPRRDRGPRRAQQDAADPEAIADPPPRPRPRRAGPVENPTDLALFDLEKKFLAGNPSVTDDDSWLAVKVEGNIVGWLVIPKRDGISDGYELTLLQQQRYAYIVISLLLIALTAIIAMPLARNLVLPIKQLARTMAQLTQGNYQARLNINRQDELGHLSRDLNELAMTLEKNDSARKRWLADISHELRTPIAVLKGEMEAVLDGVRPLDLKQMESSYQEVQRLQRLVDDLYELSSADIGGMKYRKEELDLVALVKDELPQLSQLLARAQMALTAELDLPEQLVWGDADRLCQLFSNIVVNSSKYAAEGGKVHIKMTAKGKRVEIRFEDNGPGVADEHLANLFEHLYRVEDSRNRKTGGSGLGLAICKQIVEAHQGQIRAEKSSLGGLAVVVELPRA